MSFLVMNKIDQVQKSLRIKDTTELRLQVFIWQKNLQFDKAFDDFHED